MGHRGVRYIRDHGGATSGAAADAGGGEGDELVWGRDRELVRHCGVVCEDLEHAPRGRLAWRTYTAAVAGIAVGDRRVPVVVDWDDRKRN